jgi:nitrogenase molybdenum-iron protein alpha/beta subunit
MYAQNSTVDKLFDKYENEDDITFISISKAMFKMIPKNINTGNINIKNIIHKIESMRIITSEKADLIKKMNVEFKSSVSNNKNYEELMRVRDHKSNITLNARKKGNTINELIMFVNAENNFVFIQILGNFTLDDIQKISKEINTQ